MTYPTYLGGDNYASNLTISFDLHDHLQIAQMAKIGREFSRYVVYAKNEKDANFRTLFVVAGYSDEYAARVKRVLEVPFKEVDVRVCSIDKDDKELTCVDVNDVCAPQHMF